MDPVTRVMLSADIGVMPPIPLSAALRGFGAGEVIASRRDDLPNGVKVSGFFEWADYQHIVSHVALGKHFVRLAEGVSFEDALTIYGHTAHAAFFGMIDVGAVTAGDSVVITGSAGAVGSVAGQIAKVKGAKVIGIAGGPAKCHWLVDELGFDAAVDYKGEDVGRVVARLYPAGINVLFDNVGGPMLDTLIAQLADGGRASCSAGPRASIWAPIRCPRRSMPKRFSLAAARPRGLTLWIMRLGLRRLPRRCLQATSGRAAVRLPDSRGTEKRAACPQQLV